MIGSFPSSLLDNIFLALGCAAAACAVSIGVPRSWRWKAFPLVLIGAVTLTAAVTMTFLSYRYKGYNLAITTWHLLAGLSIAGFAYWLTLTARHASGKGD
jgi:hypothetical protein